VAPARNVGFAASRGDVVAFTDDDCTFPDEWIRAAVARLEDASVGGVSGPTMIPAEETAFGRAVAVLFELAHHLAGSVHRERVDAAVDVDDLPGCNCFFRRDALARVMPTDESLVTAEDVELCLRVRHLGFRLLLAPDVRLWHHKRQSPRSLFRQMRRYAIGRLQVGRVDRELLRPAHILAGSVIPAAVMLVVALAVVSPRALVLTLALGFGALAFLAVVSAIRSRSIAVGIWVPAVILLVTVGWSIGFMQELVSPHARQTRKGVIS
jgi:GT2 family glycosyltransferase